MLLLLDIMLWKKKKICRVSLEVKSSVLLVTAGGGCYLGQSSEARIQLCALLNDRYGLLIVSDEAAVQAELVHLKRGRRAITD